jgi:hypothetical protein
MLEIVVLPDNVKSIIIGADKDRSGAGQASAEKLGRRFAGTGWDVKISLPPMPIPEGASGVDWFDYLNKEVGPCLTPLLKMLKPFSRLNQVGTITMDMRSILYGLILNHC